MTKIFDASRVFVNRPLSIPDELDSAQTRARAATSGGSRTSPRVATQRTRAMRGRAMKMTFSRIGAVGKGLLRNENVSLPHLKGKVVLGRVAAVDDNGFYRVETGFKTCVFSPMIPREPLGPDLGPSPCRSTRPDPRVQRR